MRQGRLVLFCFVEVKRVDLVHCRHRHASVHGAEDLGLRLAVEAVCEPPKALMQGLPVFNPAGDGQGRGDGAEAGNMIPAAA
jgi:hypothetical protein